MSELPSQLAITFGALLFGITAVVGVLWLAHRVFVVRYRGK